MIEPLFAFGLGLAELIVLAVCAVGCLAVTGGIIVLVIYLNKKNK